MIKFCVRIVQRWLPEPFIFAILLTFVAAVVAMPVCSQSPVEVLEHWGGGVWNLLAFAMQMALVLVCGSALAAAPAVKRGIDALARVPKSPAAAIALVTVVSALACWLNWGFGLIVGVIFAKEIARQLAGVDYRLLIASAYSGFVVWHAGLSGSIPLTMATPGESLAMATNGALVDPVPVSQTILGATTTFTGLAGDLRGDSARADVETRYLGHGDQSHDLNYMLRHHGTRSQCNLNANGVLAGRSSKTLRGTIDLIRGCKGSEGSERETVLLVDEDVRNKTVPVILCSEDDVAGNHGATIGHIREDQLFYLESRGISRQDAEAMFVSATLEQAAIDAPVEEARTAVLRLGEKLVPDFGELFD